ncbi:MAG: hypothetical protein ACU4EQ_03910 [Candidatus Nitrosoglobus sp.]|jgi:hypothetical protein
MVSRIRKNIFSTYWTAYGGFKALFKSRYLYTSIVLTLLLFPNWAKNGWWEHVLLIMPSVLGFSLGGYAMWTAIGNDDFRRFISGSEEDGTPSPYMQVNAAFVHFILLQIFSIFLALLAEAYNFSLCIIASFLAYLIFIYALMSAIAATLALLRIASWYELHLKASSKSSNNK